VLYLGFWLKSCGLKLCSSCPGNSRSGGGRVESEAMLGCYGIALNKLIVEASTIQTRNKNFAVETGRR